MKQLAGYGNVQGVYEPKTGGAAGGAPVSTTSSKVSIPQTGEEENLVLWMGLMLLSGTALAVMMFRRKRQP